MKSYWFRPKKIGVFAGYYPVSWQGWIVTIIALCLFVWGFRAADARSHSGSDTLIGFAPTALIILLAFDLITFRTGEYPWWWKKRGSDDADITK